MTARKAAAKKATAPRPRTAAKAAPARPAKAPSAAARKASPSKTAAAVKKPAAAAPKPPPPPRRRAPQVRRGAGMTERAVFEELRALRLIGTGVSAAAVRMARHVDEASSASGAAAASREMRMAMATARALGNPLSPPTRSGDEDPYEVDAGGVVVPADRLAQLRRTVDGRSTR